LGYVSLKQAEAPKNESFQQKTLYLKLSRPRKSLFEDMLDMLNPFSIFSPDASHTFIELDWNEISCMYCGRC
jgi:hypothetical protein